MVVQNQEGVSTMHRAVEVRSTGAPMVELGILNVSIVRLNISVVVFDLFSYADASTDRSLQAFRFATLGFGTRPRRPLLFPVPSH